ncbi:helix-turn-helix domain-containing protein [Thalassospiraceae bacterium LMO-SO8]|nr:helix-turn-helix domain-containing protein [Thalassospiraceae bacterium LMO-SO8]
MNPPACSGIFRATVNRLVRRINIMNIKEKMRAPHAAQYLRLSTSTLAKMRLRGDGPPYSKAGPRIVLYDRADLDAWLISRRRRSTSEY